MRERINTSSEATPQPEMWEVVQPLLDEAIAQLPERYRNPIVMVYLEGVSQQQAARKLKVPYGTLRWQLSEAIGRLRKRLAGQGIAVTSIVLTGILEHCGNHPYAELPGSLVTPGAHGGRSEGVSEGGGQAPVSSGVQTFLGAAPPEPMRIMLIARAAVGLLSLLALGSGLYLEASPLVRLRKLVGFSRVGSSGEFSDAETRMSEWAQTSKVPDSNTGGPSRSESGELTPREGAGARRGADIPEFPRATPRMVPVQTPLPDGGTIVLYSRNRYGNYPLATYAFHLGLRGDDRTVQNEVNLIFGNQKRAQRFKGEPLDHVPGALGHGSAGMDAGTDHDEFRVRCQGRNEHLILDRGKVPLDHITSWPADWSGAGHRVAVKTGHSYVVRLYDPNIARLNTPLYFKFRVLRHLDNDRVMLRWASMPERETTSPASEF